MTKMRWLLILTAAAAMIWGAPATHSPPPPNDPDRGGWAQ